MKKAICAWAFCALAIITRASFVEAVQPMVDAGLYHTVGLRSDGTVTAVGNNEHGQLNVGDWTDIIQVAAGVYHTVGLRSDGTVMAVGKNEKGQLNVSDWTDITQVAASLYHTVGLRSDGTVVAVGDNQDGQLNVSGWSDITQVVADDYYTIGLQSDGTIKAVGSYCYGMDDWTDITQVRDGNITVGLKSDSTVVVWWPWDIIWYDKVDVVKDWTNITQVAAGWDDHIIGLRSDGTLMTAGTNLYDALNVDDWTEIIQVAVEGFHTVGLKSDGTVRAVGRNLYGALNVGDWNLNVGSGQYGILEGQVTDASGGVGGVVVDLFFIGKVASTVTDSDGFYCFENVAEGNYRLHVNPLDLGPDTLCRADARLRQVVVRSQTTSVTDFVLTKINLDLYGDGDLDREDIQVIRYLRGEKSSVCPDCDLDEDGTITGLDARKAVAQCTRPGCAVE